MNALLLLFIACPAFPQLSYQKPPKSVLDVLHAPPPPDASVSPTRERMILATPMKYPPIAELAEPMLKLAGVRIIPRTRRLQTSGYWTAYRLVELPGGGERAIELPPNAKVSGLAWSADSKRFAFANIGPDSVELWVGDAASAKVRRVAGVRLNPFFGATAAWLPDRRRLLVRAVPDGQGAPPAGDAAPKGPSAQDSTGQKTPSSTYEVRDVLKNPHDEELFQNYAATQLLIIDAETGAATPLGKPDLYAGVSPAPDGKHLLVTTIRRPFSYMTTHDRFPREIDVWDHEGRLVRRVASVPLADQVPIWGVRTGPREFEWRPTEPATLVWLEALDGGDWNTQVPHRDRILLHRAPFSGEPVEVLRVRDRAEQLWWTERPELVLVRTGDEIKHWTRTLAANVDDPKSAPRLVWDMSSDEAYRHPGYPVFKVLPSGFYVARVDDGAIHLSGAGASPEGRRPFLDRLELATLATERLWRCDRSSLESFVAWLDAPRGVFMTRRETPDDPPNFYRRALGKKVQAPEGEAMRSSSIDAITRMPDPTPQLRRITKRLVRYKRADGLDLSFTLYLPPDYKEGTKLPAIVWAYPLDYADAKMAGQVTTSTHTFTTLGWPLHLFPLLEGYAIIDNPLMPVVGDANKIYDTYLEQLVAGAQAAVDTAAGLGMIDRDRLGVTGHSHGGLMTVNLLAHTDLFRAGVARSGAYNRTLTAFGFQNERRTVWQAPDVYLKVSPFFHVDKLTEPLLLIHGDMDVNPGTISMQSEKLFEALKGNGKTARLVMLPFESHGYRSLESTEHALYELLAWFDRHVKNAPPRAAGTAK
ncbi:MAG: S9 family peptidase [Elusimicrobia bacterium]|nr:S9 family peptidase [Elusimicrobiota bacterium]